MVDVSSPTSSQTGFAWVDSIFERTHPVGSVYHRINDWRISLDLSNPGTTENLGREVKCEQSWQVLSSSKEWDPTQRNLLSQSDACHQLPL
jgi:hypothetical protein